MPAEYLLACHLSTETCLYAAEWGTQLQVPLGTCSRWQIPSWYKQPHPECGNPWLILECIRGSWRRRRRRGWLGKAGRRLCHVAFHKFLDRARGVIFSIVSEQPVRECMPPSASACGKDVSGGDGEREREREGKEERGGRMEEAADKGHTQRHGDTTTRGVFTNTAAALSADERLKTRSQHQSNAFDAFETRLTT